MQLKLDNISLFSLITIASFFLLLPFAFFLEGDLYSVDTMTHMVCLTLYQIGSEMWCLKGVLDPTKLMMTAVIAGIFFHLYQQVRLSP